MQAHNPLVALIGRQPNSVLDAVLEPRVQVLADGQILGVEVEAILPVRDRLGELRRHLLACILIHRLALAPFRHMHDVLPI